ncbi:MAG: alpha/beta hydrolase [Actinomycetota bacterium]|nr:alpha/beta hydrolase [Actinomycetota bacterium]
MHLNEFAEGLAPLEMHQTDEFVSLCQSAADLGISHAPSVAYASRNLVLRHLRFHFLQWGIESSQPVLFLHGSNQSAHSWDLVSLHLADRFRIYALDQRGHGDSEWCRDSDYSSAAMGLDAAAFIDALGLDHLIVVGHSMGGQNAMRLALSHPERVTKLVLVDIGPEVSALGAKTIRRFVTETREFDDLDHFVARVQEYDPYRTREHIERTVKYNLVRRADGKFISKHDHGPRLAATGEHRERGDRFTLDDVRDLPMPMLLIRGADSNILEADAAQRFVDAVPDGCLITVPKAGHNVQSQNTPAFLDALVPFLLS